MVLSGITWYFFDDIKPIGSSILAWINISRTWNSSDLDDSPNGNTQTNPKLQSLKDWVKNKIYKQRDDNNPLNNSPSFTSIKMGESSKLVIIY